MDSDHGDQTQADEFVVLYTRHEQQLFRFVATLVPLRSDAEDVAQETARVLWQKFGEYDPQRPFLPWACGVARFQVLNYLQRARTHRKHFSAALVEELAQQRVANDERLAAQQAALEACLKQLPADDRQLLQERYRDQATLVARAEQLGRSVNALYKRLGRIRGKITDCVYRRLAKEGWS